jgi:MFS family permease
VEIIEPESMPPDGAGRRAQRNLVPIVGGQAVSLFGDYIAYFTLPYFMLALTGDALDLGLTAAAETLPMLLFGLAAGVFLDRRRRLGRTLIGVDLVRAVSFGALAIASASSWITPSFVFLIAFIVGSMAVIFDSGLQSWMTTSLVTDDLVRANAQLGLARTITLSIGPLVGGIVVAVAGGFALAFGINAATFVLSALFLAMVRPIAATVPHRREPFGTAIGAGVRILWRDRRLRWGTIGGTLTNFVFQPLEALLVLYVATKVLDVGTINDALTDKGLQIGLFFALQAAIGSIGVAFAGRMARRFALGTMYVIGLAMLGAGFLVVAVLQSWLAVIPAGIAITGVTWVNVALVTMRQRLAPQEQMGRVIAASRTFAWAGLPLGAAIGGLLAGWIGVIPVYVAGSSGVIIVAMILTRTALFRDRVMGTGGRRVSPAVDPANPGS